MSCFLLCYAKASDGSKRVIWNQTDPKALENRSENETARNRFQTGSNRVAMKPPEKIAGVMKPPELDQRTAVWFTRTTGSKELPWNRESDWIGSPDPTVPCNRTRTIRFH